MLEAPQQPPVGLQHKAALSDVKEEGSELLRVDPDEGDEVTEPSSAKDEQPQQVLPFNGRSNSRLGSPMNSANPAMAGELKGIIDKLTDARGNLDMRTVTTALWHNRRHKQMVQTIAEHLIANSNERAVFNGVEFYLPQLAHMIIHLDVDVSSTVLEQFSLVVAQQSLHVALQLNWILVAAMEDYQPELPDGMPNPKANPTYFTRCIKLLQNVERIVALGSPGDDSLLDGPQQEKELIKLRAEQAKHVIAAPVKHAKLLTAPPEGYLWHKRWMHRKKPHRNRWVKRWFCLVDRVLYCRRSEAHEGEHAAPDPDNLKRAMVLHHATVEVNPQGYKEGKYPNYFTVESPMGKWRLRADTAADTEMWVQALQAAAGAPPVILSIQQAEELEANQTLRTTSKKPLKAVMEADSQTSLEAAAQQAQDGDKDAVANDEYMQLDEDQAKRYDFFNAEREFVRCLTDICEELRFVDRSQRASMLEDRLQAVRIPDVAYLPLVKSTDLFRRVLRITPAESTPFSTKARCPALITFETAAQFLEDHASDEEEPLDVANFMHWTYISSRQEDLHDMNTSTSALDGFRSMDPAELRAPNGESGATAPLDPRAMFSGERRASFFGSIPKPHLPHMPVSLNMPSINISTRSGMPPGSGAPGAPSTAQATPGGPTVGTPSAQATGTTAGGAAAAGGAAGGGGAAVAGGVRGGDVPRRLRPSRPNVWRQERPPSVRQASGMFSPFGGRTLRPPSFKVPSLQVPKMISMRWGSEHAGSPHVASAGATMGGSAPDGTVVAGAEGGEQRRRAQSWGQRSQSTAGTETGAPLPAAATHHTTHSSPTSPHLGASASGGVKADREAAIGETAAGQETAVAGKTATAADTAAHAVEAAQHGLRSGDDDRTGDNGSTSSAGDYNERDLDPVDQPMGGTDVLEPAADSLKLVEAAPPPPARVSSGSAVAAAAAAAAAAAEGGEEGGAEVDGGEGGQGSRSVDAAGVVAVVEKTASEIAQRANLFFCHGESLNDKVLRLKQASAQASIRGWGVERIIAKSNDDLRQEVFIMQLIYFYLEVFQKEHLDLWLQPYRILSTSKTTGLIQVLDNSISLHGLKNKQGYPGSLAGVFVDVYGPPGSQALDQARRRFAQSLAGYSVVSYLLAFKDRHNGNIMINNEGRLVHIDFGFVFGQAPGNKFSMERAYFKLTGEYVEVMGGRDSDTFKYYVDMVGKGLVAARKYATVALTLLEIMMFQSEFPCFANGAAPAALRNFKRRLMMGLADEYIMRRARHMVDQSLDHRGTVAYDWFQKKSNNINP